MNVFFCETFDDGTVGGSHACLYNLIRNLDRSAVRCTVGFYGPNVYVSRYRALGVGVEILPFRRPRRIGFVVWRKLVNWYYRNYQAGRYLAQFFRREGFDLVVLNNSIYASLLFVRVCRTLKIPVVVYERGIGRLERRHIAATANIQASIAISDEVYDAVRRAGFRTPIVERIYDGIDPATMIPCRKPDELKTELGIPVSARVVGIVGNVRPWKGHRYFLDAYRRMADEDDNLWAVIAGGWGEEDREYQLDLQATVDRAGLSDRVKFLGYRSDIPDLLSIFDVFVHASIKPEPFGMVILEAVAAKKPVVATNIGGPVEILDGGHCGLLVPPENGAAIAEACRQYLQDPSFASEKVQRAYDRVLQRFHIHQTVERTMDLFERILRGGARAEGPRGAGGR